MGDAPLRGCLLLGRNARRDIGDVLTSPFFLSMRIFVLPFSRNGRCRKGGGWSKQAQGERRSVRANVGGFYTWRLAPPPCSSNQMSALASNEADSRAICEGKAMI
jgi:hypothetical protein